MYLGVEYPCTIWGTYPNISQERLGKIFLKRKIFIKLKKVPGAKNKPLVINKRRSKMWRYKEKQRYSSKLVRTAYYSTRLVRTALRILPVWCGTTLRMNYRILSVWCRLLLRIHVYLDILYIRFLQIVNR